MTDGREPEELRAAYERTVVELGSVDPAMVVIEAGPAPPSTAVRFATKFPERSFLAGSSDPSPVILAAQKSEGGRAVFASGSVAQLVGPSYSALRESICRRRANVKLVALDGGLSPPSSAPFPPMLEDLGLLRGLPGMTVVVPADGPTTAAATRALASFSGPAYLRLAPGILPTVSDGTFQIGRAPTVREGSDLTIVAVGAMLRTALDVADELARVGVSVRVLDFASVKPFDVKALLRAARDTGAILTMEEHSVLTGVGALVASATAEEAPVPVRRVGVPDVLVEPSGPGDARDRLGLSKERCLEEAWVLLRARGKVQ
ncbi:MAG TPA: transketolase C-terminal domain-containing protein [Thermoplasmata archaeon]|nr:transketolase C-terminal domain-containing protein [Thermoplasmata archaeon]